MGPRNRKSTIIIMSFISFILLRILEAYHEVKLKIIFFLEISE